MIFKNKVVLNVLLLLCLPNRWDDVYSSIGFERAGFDVRKVANSALVRR